MIGEYQAWCLKLTLTVNLSLKFDWLIGMFFLNVDLGTYSTW